LLDIVKEVGITIERCAYIGDSLFKDVAMGRDLAEIVGLPGQGDVVLDV
jgi:predicted HAD superfamily phosphohydrolase YqeG